MLSTKNITKFFESNKNIFSAAISCLALYSVVKIIKCIRNSRKLRTLGEKREKARNLRDSKIDIFLKCYSDKVSDDVQQKIIELDVTTLAKMIKSKTFSCEEVMITYAIRAGTIGRELNLIADIDFERALTDAKRADINIAEGKELGDLHGIPVSFYELISVQGLTTTCGYTNYYNNVNTIDSMIVTSLKKHGAIPFAKSNIPQGFMALEASNFLWGDAKNPWNIKKTTGGSNGGEADLIAARCSPFGIGSDIFGSIRHPSSNCGVYGFKPTSMRNSKHGAITYNGTSFVGFQPYSTSWGPICRSAEDVVLISRCLFGTFEEDIYVNNEPFNDSIFNKIIDNNNKPTKIGYVLDLENCPTAPGIKFVIEDLIKNLKTQGYILEIFDLNRFEEFVQIGMSLLANSDVLELIHRELGEEPMKYYYSSFYSLRNKYQWLLKLMSIFKSLKGEKRTAQAIKNFKNMNLHEYIEATRRFFELRSEFIQYWKENKFEAIITPVFPTPAMDFEVTHKFMPFNHFCYLFNFVDMPSVTIPICLNQSTEYNDTFDDELTLLIKTQMKTSLGLPLSIQVGALPNQDEWVLRLMSDINYFYQFDQKFGNKIFEKLHIINVDTKPSTL